MIIGLDFGHGVSYDGGAVGIIKEEIVIDAIGSDLKIMLEEAGYEVILLRPLTANSLIDSLSKRCIAANNANVDLVVSIHANIGGGTRHEVLISSFGGKAEQHAKTVYNTLNEISNSKRGVKVANLEVLKGTNAPAFLIELFFLDTLSDIDLYNYVGSKSYAKGVWIESQYLDYEKCEELRGKLGGVFWSIKEE